MSQRLPDASLFRAYDIRGIVGTSLFAEDAASIGRAFASEVTERLATDAPTITIARDARLSSPMLRDALVEGLIASGARVIDSGIGPTPYLYFAAQHLSAHGAIMITGSHNPKDHNGMKCVIDGKPFYADALAGLRTRIAQKKLLQRTGSLQYLDLRADYLAAITQEMDGLSLKQSVLWDAGNGAASEIIVQLTPHIAAAQHGHLFCSFDGHFPNHHPDPSDPHCFHDLLLARLQHTHAIGLAFDGDGDRLGVMDERGRILSPDHLLMLLARDVLTHTPGATILADVKTSDAVFADVRAHGGHAVMAKTGHALIKQAMREHGAAFAGEASGHLFFADRYFGYDDGLYAALRVLRIVAESGRLLCELVDDLPTLYASPEWRIPCPDAQKFTAVETLADYASRLGYQVGTLDGVRVSSASGWWLVRASNTQAALVARCEGVDEASLAAQTSELTRALAQVALSLP